jgi:hypothetical protein
MSLLVVAFLNRCCVAVQDEMLWGQAKKPLAIKLPGMMASSQENQQPSLLRFPSPVRVRNEERINSHTFITSYAVIVNWMIGRHTGG